MSTIPTPPTIKVVGYVRGSTDDQILTLEAQAQQIAAYCAYKGYELVNVYVDQGESAFAVNFYDRPIAAAMMAEMPALGATGVIITKLDRGFRNALDCLFTLDDFKRKKIDLHLLDIQLDTTSPVGELLVTMMAGIAQFENRRRSERQKAAFVILRQQLRLCGELPYGWRNQNGQLVPDEEEQRILRMITEGGEWGDKSHNETARLLNLAEVPAKKGGKWGGSSVRSIRRTALIAEDNSAPEDLGLAA